MLRGLEVRIALADPDGEEAKARDRFEGLAGRCRAEFARRYSIWSHCSLALVLRCAFTGVPLYNALYRFDDQMLVTPYLYRLHGYQHPLLHLKRLGPAGIFESYAQQFEAIWSGSRPSSRRVEVHVSKRVDYYHDRSAPAANSLVVGSSAIVVEEWRAASCSSAEVTRATGPCPVGRST